MLSVTFFNWHAKCHYSERHYAECHDAKHFHFVCHSDECHKAQQFRYAKFCNAKCR